MSGWPLLTIVTFLPLVGAIFIMFVRGSDEVVARNARMTALWTSLITFAISVLLWVDFDAGSADFQFVEYHDWLPAFGISYQLGVDGISLPLCRIPTLSRGQEYQRCILFPLQDSW